MSLSSNSTCLCACRDAAVHPSPALPDSLPGPAGSGQVTLRHPETTIYRCFLSDLTGFIGFRRAGPGLQHHLTRVDLPG